MLNIINNGIDAVETAKKSFVKTVVTNAELAKPLNTFIEAQAKFARQYAASVNEFATTAGLATFSADLKKAFATK